MANSRQSSSVVIFALGEVRFGLEAEVIERVVRAVEVTPVADAPPGVLGVINLHGRAIMVLDIRPRFGLATRPIELSDHLVIGRAGDRDVAVLVDAAVDVLPTGNSAAVISMDTLAGGDGLARVVVQGGELVPVQELSRLLPAEPRKPAELKLAA